MSLNPSIYYRKSTRISYNNNSRHLVSIICNKTARKGTQNHRPVIPGGLWVLRTGFVRCCGAGDATLTFLPGNVRFKTTRIYQLPGTRYYIFVPTLKPYSYNARHCGQNGVAESILREKKGVFYCCWLVVVVSAGPTGMTCMYRLSIVSCCATRSRYFVFINTSGSHEVPLRPSADKGPSGRAAVGREKNRNFVYYFYLSKIGPNIHHQNMQPSEATLKNSRRNFEIGKRTNKSSKATRQQCTSLFIDLEREASM